MLFLSLLVSGCHTPLAVKQMQAKNPLAKNAAKTPVEIVDVWSSYAQTTPEGKIIRGMAGRIHFYDTQSKGQPVKVDGDLIVFVFDGNDSDPDHTKPIKIFQFDADTLDQHYSHQKPLGHGYNFFLPIDELGGEEKSLSIIARFDNSLTEGRVMGQPINTLLAGRRPPTPTDPTIREFLESRSLLAEAHRNATAHYAPAIQQAAYITAAEVDAMDKVDKVDKVAEMDKVPEPPRPAVNPRVTTIPLNNNITRRIVEVAVEETAESETMEAETGEMDTEEAETAEMPQMPETPP